MNSRYLILTFRKHLAENAGKGKSQQVSPGSAVSVLYGTDQFKIDRHRGAVRLPDVGWIECPALKGVRVQPEWAGVIRVPGGGYEVQFGVGNPFERDVPAVPFSLIDMSKAATP